MDTMNRHPLLLILISIFLFGSLHAQIPTYPKLNKTSFTYTTSAVSKPLYVRGNGIVSNCLGPQAGSRLQKATLYAFLDWESDELVNGAATEYQVALNILGYSSYTGSSGLLATYTHTLTVKSNKPQSYVAIDFTGLHSVINRFEVTATYSLIAGSANTNVQNVMQTDVYYTEEYEYSVSNTGTPILFADQVLFSGNEATFKWQLECPTPPPNYQFQLLRLFNNDIATSSSETNITTKLEWENALTIETGNSLRELSLTLAEGTGYYIWRVRPIGNIYEGGIANDLNWGVWSATGSYTEGNTYNISSNATPYLFFYNQFDNDMNWIFSRTFVEGDAQTYGQVNIGEGISYANSLQMARQQQSRLRTEKKKLVGQTIYDHSGRPAMSTMAAPVNDNTLGYISGYIKNAGGNVYSATDFDEDLNYKNPPAMDMSNPGPGKYYSNNNDLESDVPTADGYAYSRTLYMNDGTSTPKEQSGPGLKHKLGNIGANKHTTRNYISSVADAELIRVFGDEAPDAAGVLKSITTDANNGSSISYVSKEGQTIATCLSNPGAPNLDPLSPVAVPLAVEYYLNNNSSMAGGQGLIAFKNIVLTEPAPVTISYSLTPNVYEDNCVDFCATCDYKVSIKVIDNDDPSAAVPPVPEYTTVVNPTSGSSDCTPGTTNYSTTITLPAGSYTIQRTIEAYQVNPSSTPPAGTVAYTSFLDQYLKQVENGMLNGFNTGTAVIVDDLGVPVPGAPSVNMTTFHSFLPPSTASDPNPVPDIDGLYAYLGIAPNSTQDHINLQIGCNTITLPINRCPSDECPPDGDFEKYFTDWYATRYGTTVTISALLPGYAAGEFNTVIDNMIHCGGYDCKALYSCWRTIVSSYETIYDMNGMDLSASDNGYSMPAGSSYTPNFLDMFLDCAGYKLAGINNNPGGSGCGSLGYKFHPYAYFAYTAANRCTNCEALFYLQPATTPPNALAAPVYNTGSSPYTWTSESDFALDLNASGANYAQMHVFFDCIQLCNTTGATTTPATFANNAIADCIETCEGRYAGFVTQLIEEYHRNNVHVEGDQYQLAFYAPYNYYIFNTVPYTYDPVTDISMATIYCQAQGLVDACKSQCVLTVSTTGGQTNVGTPAEITAMANAMYGVYDLEIPSPGCSPGYSSTSGNVSSAAFIKYAVNVLNQKLAELRSTSPVNGFYWDYKTFLTTHVSAVFSNSQCDYGNYILIHPDIPSYFDYEPDPTGTACFVLAYYFNKAQANSPLAPKRLYSASLIPPPGIYPSEGFNYVSTTSSTGAAALTEQITTAHYSYLITAGFSPHATSALTTSGMDLTSVYNAGTITNATSLYGYKLSGGADNGFYKAVLCSRICQAAAGCSTICYKINPVTAVPVNAPLFEEQGVLLETISCEQELASQIMNSFYSQTSVAISSELVKIKDAYRQKCINELVDQTKISFAVNYHHYTLYYFDRAGNLVKTVPPRGVDATVTSRATHPGHTLITEYAYNSLKEIVRQKTPDGGETKFWYDKVARLRFSQNQKQLVTTNKMSYTKYDALGRVYEAGEMPVTLNPSIDADNEFYPMTGMTDIVSTKYTDPASVAYFGGKTQRYLQNRVSYGYSDKDGDPTTTEDQVATYYSYDPHGNVEWLILDIPEIGKNYIAYEYDLISGSVLKVKYNEEFADRFFHRYSYDVDKRLKTVETSKDEIFWEKDASYKYYLHGPLKRSEIGHDKVQGLDYTYTIMGWLKGLNHVDNAYDPGKDGNETGNAYFAKDAYSMHLGYYEGDYISKFSRSNSETTNPYYLAANVNRNLYNGNISTWISNYDYSSLPANTLQHQSIVAGRVFNYDELNRIKSSDFRLQNAVTKLWSSSSNYRERFTYDANGNITKVDRTGYTGNAGGLNMDKMTYSINSANNQLDYVTDDISASAYTIDLDGQSAGNYGYDQIGNLTSDLAGGISSIDWNPQGKVSKIAKSDNTLIEFLYDMMGRRVYKKVYKAADPVTLHRTTYYVTDASGNQMAMYTRTNTTIAVNSFMARFDLNEQPVYGSDRIGERVLTSELFRDVPFTNTVPPAGRSLPAPVNISDWPQIMIPVVNSTSTQVSNRPMNLSSGTNTATDVGGATNAISVSAALAATQRRNQATVYDNSGNLLLTAYTYQTNTPADLTRIYAAGNANVFNSHLVSASADNQSIFIKRPGSEHEYFYVTIDASRKALFHTVDASAAAMVNYNNPIDNSLNFGQSMAAIDNRLGTPVLYLLSYSGTTATIRAYTVTHDGFVPAASTYTFTSSAYGSVGDMQISPNGTKLALANTVTGTTGEVRMYSLGADHLISGPLGQLSLGSSNAAKAVAFTQGNLYIYFTHQNGSTARVYRQLVSAFTGGAVALPGAALQTISGANMIGMIRRGNSGNMYYVSNLTAALTTSNIYMISSPEAATPTVSAANPIANTATSGSLPTKAHVIDYQLPSPSSPVYARTLDRKVYELKDHLGNVHSTISDYKLRITTDANVKVHKKFNDATTEGFAIAGGSPGSTIVDNINNQLRVYGTLGSSATIALAVPGTLPVGKYVLSFDYNNLNASLASYSVVNGSAQLKGYMSSSGRKTVAFEVFTAGTVNLSFTCEDVAANKTFYIDNVLIKTVTGTMADPIVIMNDDFASGGNWTPDVNATVTYPSGVMQVTRVGAPAGLSVSKDVPLIPGLLYKVSFNLNALNLVGGTLNLEYKDNNSAQTGYSYFVRNTNGIGAYTYYFVPQDPEGSLSFEMTGMGAGTFSLTLDNVAVTQYENSSQPLYTAKLNSLTDYYAFGAPMPGRTYSGATGYRYGFGGQEKDNEVYGDGNLNTAEFWEYDTRLGRRWNVDPKLHESWSPYACFSDNPIFYSDPYGDTVKYEHFGAMIKSFFKSLFNKKYRQDLKDWNESRDIYVISDLQGEKGNYSVEWVYSYTEPERQDQTLNRSDYATEEDYQADLHDKYLNVWIGTGEVDNSNQTVRDRKREINSFGINKKGKVHWGFTFGAETGDEQFAFFEFGAGDWIHYNMFFMRRTENARTRPDPNAMDRRNQRRINYNTRHGYYKGHPKRKSPNNPKYPVIWFHFMYYTKR